MTKRAILDLGEGIFRVSKPGIDVDTAGPTDFLLHESHLYAQPYFFQFVACPFAGDATSGNRDETVPITVPDVTDDPIVILYAQNDEARNVYPGGRALASGGSVTPGWSVHYTVISSVRVDVRFFRTSIPFNPNGAFLILARRPEL